jgi:RNA polymerase sigma factor for flagellar operon FliA
MSQRSDQSSALDSPEAIQALWAAYIQQRDDAQRERLILHYAPLVKRVVGRMGLRPDGAIEWEDLTNYGLVGLIDAVERYDPSRGILFSTFASLRIRGAVLDALRQLDPLGRQARRRVREAREAIQDLTVNLGRVPDDHEVAAQIGLSEEQYQQVLIDASLVMLSLDQPVADGGDGQKLRLGELIEDPNAVGTLEQVEEMEMQERLMGAIQALPRREQVLLSLYYYEDLTMREVASVMDISQTRVCQLHARALMNLKALLSPQTRSRSEQEDSGLAQSTSPAPAKGDRGQPPGNAASPAREPPTLDRRKASYRAQRRWSKLLDEDESGPARFNQEG